MALAALIAHDSAHNFSFASGTITHRLLTGIFMNPMEWLKAIYETFGTPYPRASLIAVMVLGAILSGAFWLVLARQIEKDRVASAPPQISGPATAGNGSIANTGGGNTINQSSPPEKKPPKKE